MRLIDRYLLREFLFWLAVFFAGFLMIWIAFDLGLDLHRFQTAHMRGKDVVEYYFYEIPEFVPVALPVAILLATLYVVTNHARYNEITAIRAAGVSLLRLCLPYFAAGFALSALLFAFNEYFAPHAGDMADEILIRRDPTVKAQHDLIPSFVFVSYRTTGKPHKLTATVYNSKTHEMTAPLITWPSSNGMDISVSANTAKWTNHMWVLSGNVIKTLGVTTRLPVTDPLPLPEIPETPAEIQSDIKVNKYHNTTTKTRRADIPLNDIVNYLRFHPNPDRKMRSWLFTKLHGRFAGPFACLVVVIVAIPFSARSGRRNIFVGVAASIFIFFVYFVLQQVGLTFGETGWMPPWLGAWFPNLFFGLGGLYLMSRVR